MILGPSLLALPAALILASSPASKLGCTVPSPPQINIKVTTDDIEYIYDKSSSDLNQLRGDAGKQSLGADTATGGLRADTPQIKSQVGWKVKSNRARNIACMWYDVITVSIELDPTIYIAKEFSTPECRMAIMDHERMHVKTDHLVMNQFAQRVGTAISNVVNSDGLLGPFDYAKIDLMQDASLKRIDAAIKREQALMEQDMHQRQALIDTMEEYKRISAICKDIKLKR